MCTWTDRFTELESESDSEIEAESSNVKMSELKEKKKQHTFYFFITNTSRTEFTVSNETLVHAIWQCTGSMEV